MAIKELKGWFDDKAKNKFKIDGITYGSLQQKDHFIITQRELADRYCKISNEPDKGRALRGDLTAMLTNMKPIFAYQFNKKDLFERLQILILNHSINTTRYEVNVMKLQTDARKFDFRPNGDLLYNGCTADVKREIYRFPSILLLDINIVAQKFRIFVAVAQTSTRRKTYLCSVAVGDRISSCHCRIHEIVHISIS